VPVSEILTLPIPKEGLSAQQWRLIDEALKEWEVEVRESVKRLPARGYKLGTEQTLSFLRLLGAVGQADLPPSGAAGPTKRLAVEWLDRYTLNEIDGALAKYLDEIRNAILYGLQGGVNPTQVASWLYDATRDAQVNWRMIARTEMVRANAAGRLDSIDAMGYDQVWAPRHTGACGSCRRLLEGKVFSVEEVRNATNFNRPQREWVAAIPLHPHCRHVWLPYIEDVFEEAQAEYRALEDNGLDDATLNEMFETSGQLKPEYENDPRLAAYFETTGKTVDVLEFALGKAIAKSRRQEPPGLHHTSNPTHNCHSCEWMREDGECGRYNWQVDRDEVCESWEGKIEKGFFDNPQLALDPLLWTEDERLKADVRQRIVRWWRHVFTDDAPLWSRLYVVGSACSRAWAGRKTPGDVDVHLLVDYPALRAAHPEYALLSEADLHTALVTQVKAMLEGVEAAPGLGMDAYFRSERTREEFEQHAARTGQGVWDVQAARWVAPPPVLETVEDPDDGLEGLGASLALAHPEWVRQAKRLAASLEAALGDSGANQELEEAYELVHGLRQAGFESGAGDRSLGQFLWQYLMTYGPLARVKHRLHSTPLGKVFPHYEFTVEKEVAAAQGTEHWITVHPHGENEKGIPVLVRENGDGTATVIGGAGGHLDYLRIGGKGRIKEDAKPKDRQAAEQAGSEEEAEGQRAQQEEAAEKARDIKERAQGELKEAQDRVENLVRDIVNQSGVTLAGEQAGWNDLSAAQQKQLVKQAVADSLYQSSYGSLQDSKRADAPAGPIAVTPAPKEKGDEEAKGEGAEGERTAEGEANDERKPSTRLRISMPTEHADQLQEELAGASLMRRRVRESNRIIGGEAKPTDASTLEWEPVDKPAEAQRRASELARQQINRELLGEVADAKAKSGKRDGLIGEAMRQGGFDAFDSFTYGVFGKTLLPTQVQRLLGVNGTAQLLAHEMQQRAKNGETNLKQLQTTIDEITEERQESLTRLDLNRARLAAREARAMGDELKASAEGNSLFTLTAARSRQTKKLREAAQALGMAVSGSEALHSLRAILQQPVDKVQVDGYGSKSQIMELAQKAGVQVTDRDIVRNGAGNYSLHISPDRMSALLDPQPDRNESLRSQLEKIRTGEQLDGEIEKAQHPPGYSRTLDRAQAQGSMYLRAAGSGVLAFAPGVGKTDTAIASALEVMASKPGSRALIVAPKTALAGTWAKTIQATCPGKSLQIFGTKGPEEGQEASHDWEAAGKLGGSKRKAQAESAADFNIISYDTLKKNPELVKQLGHNMVITDEAQYAKNPNSQRLEGLDQAAEGAEHRWALTGTPLEKNMGELHTILNWAKPGAYGSRKAFDDRFGRINQFEHLTGEEKVQQFRESISDGLFYQGQNVSNMPPAPDLQWEDTPLAEGHEGAYREAVNEFNSQWQERHAAAQAGEQDLPSLPSFGGRDSQMAALMKPHARGYQGPNTRVNKIADLVAGNKPVDFKGFQGHSTHADGSHAGTYAPKSVIFGQQTQPLQPIKDELEARGTHKVFYTDGSVSDNDQRLQAFKDHKGPAVLITSDTNKTARSLQFGDDNGKFQHGATQMIHADMPMNNADLQQRVARIYRRGAQAPVDHRILYSGTPVERSGRDQLANELRTQQAVGNPEDKVGERQTIGQKLRRAGQKRLKGRKRDE